MVFTFTLDVGGGEGKSFVIFMESSHCKLPFQESLMIFQFVINIDKQVRAYLMSPCGVRVNTYVI